MKGILIIFVIIGHTYVDNNIKNIIFWFHMPLFFILSGYLIKETNGVKKYEENKKKYIKNKLARYIIPYFSFYILNCIFIRKISLKSFIKILYGGQNLGGVYWFPVCMVISIIIFLQINVMIKNCKVKKAIIFILYLIAIIESNLVKRFNINSFIFPICIGIQPLAITYISIGYFWKEKIQRKEIIDVIVVIFSILLILMQIFNIINVEIDMKYEKYTNIVFVVLIPMLFFIIISNISKLIEKSKIIGNILAYIGQASMIIMYLHLLIKSYFIDIVGEHYSIILYVIFTLGICCLIKYIFSKNSVTQKIFITG